MCYSIIGIKGHNFAWKKKSKLKLKSKSEDSEWKSESESEWKSKSESKSESESESKSKYVCFNKRMCDAQWVLILFVHKVHFKIEFCDSQLTQFDSYFQYNISWHLNKVSWCYIENDYRIDLKIDGL